MIYISGKITGTTDYLKRFAVGEMGFKFNGISVINPAAVCDRLPELKHKDYMKICMSLLSFCDTIYMLKDWKDSVGAKMEHKQAIKDDLKILYEVE